VEAFFFPAYQAVIPQITPPELLTSANSLNGLSQRVTGIIGPMIGAGLVAVGGTPLAFALDALSFFISAAFVFQMLRERSYEQQAQQDSPESGQAKRSAGTLLRQGFADLREGWNAIISVPWIWITILVFGFLNIMEGSPRAVAMPFLIKNDLGADVSLLGFLGSAFSVGYVAGALWLGQYKRLRHRGPLGYIATMMNGVVLLLFGLKFPIPVLVGGMVLYGISFSIFGLVWNNTLQEMVPHDLLGRVYSIDALGSFVLLPIGYAIAGWATDLAGAPMVFLVGGAGTIVLMLLGLSHPAIRNLD
jgi:DHA3 family tetracycline resistance protein-like MFS transporter